MIEFDKKTLINIVWSLLAIFLVAGVFWFQGYELNANPGLWPTLFMLVLIYLELSDMRKKK